MKSIGNDGIKRVVLNGINTLKKYKKHKKATIFILHASSFFLLDVFMRIKMLPFLFAYVRFVFFIPFFHLDVSMRV